MLLTEISEIPPGLRSCDARQLNGIFSGPTLLHLPGGRDPALFVSVLLHGNETTGFEAIQVLLERYRNKPLPRSLSILFGNVEAAAEGLRRKDGQPDYNRVWPPGGDPNWPETQTMAHVVAIMRERGVFASVDVHNNTGANPHYGCINRLESEHIGLAGLFSHTLMYFTRPEGVCSMALGRLGPATTIECGQVGQHSGVAHVVDYLERLLHLESVADAAGRIALDPSFQLLEHVATVVLHDGVRASLTPGPDRLCLPATLDQLNFQRVEAGEVFGYADTESVPVFAVDEQGDDVTARYFELVGGQLRARQSLIPSMLTLDTRVIQQDCLCHLLSEKSLPAL